MVLAVTGSRLGAPPSTLRFVHRLLVRLAPRKLHEGGALGVDRQVRGLAVGLGIPYRTFDADWDRLGHYAGPERNGRMLAEADVLLALPGDVGTADAVRQARELGLSLIEVDPTPARQLSLFGLDGP